MHKPGCAWEAQVKAGGGQEACRARSLQSPLQEPWTPFQPNTAAPAAKVPACLWPLPRLPS